MNPFASIRSEARRQRDSLLLEIQAQLHDKDGADLEALLKRLSSLSTLTELRSRREQIIDVLVPGTCAALLLLAGWSIPVSRPAIELAAQATRVDLTVQAARELDLGKLPAIEKLNVEGLERVRSDAGTVNLTAVNNPGSAFVDGASSVSKILLQVPTRTDEDVTSATVAPLGRIVVVRRDRSAEIAAEGFSVVVMTEIEGPVRVVSAAGTTVRQATLAEASLKLEGPAMSNGVVRLSFVPAESAVNLPILRTTGLALNERGFDSTGQLQESSSISKGTLRLVRTGREHDLPRGTNLTLAGLDGTSRVSLERDGVHVSFKGTARTVTMGAGEGLTRDLRPSVAEWLGRDRALALVWSGFMFLLGLVWSLKRSLTGRTR